MIVPDIDNTEMPLQRLFHIRPAAASVFLAHRMLCLGCPIAPFHTVTDACQVYRLDETWFRRELHAALSAPKS